MSTSKDGGEDISIQTEAYYEMIASQEEIYLEETEEELRAILVFDDLLPSSNSGLVSAENCAAGEPGWAEAGPAENATQATSTVEEVNLAAEELITGDSDDPPLGEETIAEMMANHLDIARPGRM